MNFKLVFEDEAIKNPRLLGELWDSRQSFALAPRRYEGDITWLNSTLKAIPLTFKSGHYGLYTSGTTGKPKLVIGSMDRSENLARLLHQAQENECSQATLCALPLAYSFAFVNQWLWSHILHRKFVPTPGFKQPEKVAQKFSAIEDAMICLVASQVPLLFQHLQKLVFPKINRVHFAGEPFPLAHLGFLERMFPNANFYNNYGCAEAMPRISVSKVDHSTDSTNVGRPLKGIKLRATSDQMLEFNSPYQAVAIVQNGNIDFIAENEFLKTGDIATQRSDGSWTITGRHQHTFKRFGEKVSPQTVVATLAPTINGAIAVYLTNDVKGQLGFNLVLSPEPEPSVLRKLLTELRESFTRSHWPIRIESMDSLPSLPNGKIDVQALKDAENKKLHWRQRI